MGLSRRMSVSKRGIWFVMLVALTAAWWGASRAVHMSAGFFVKNLCSAVFVAQRDAQEVVNNDLRVYGPAIIFNALQWSVHKEAGWVSAGIPLLAHASAAYVEAQGCRRVDTSSSEGQQMKARRGVVPLAMPAEHPSPWPEGDVVSEVVHSPTMNAALDLAFSLRDAQGQSRTRAVVVVHKGKIVAERYAESTATNPIQIRRQGWSMAKSMTVTMLGSEALRANLPLDQPLATTSKPFLAWQGSQDAREQITLRHLMTMSSGLQFDESYSNPFSAVNQMLFVDADATNQALQQKPQFAPGTVFKYSSGTTHLLSLWLKDYAKERYDDLPRSAIFKPLGMRSALMERDAAGTYLGSSFVWATARDWAKFGLLYLQRGQWFGSQVVSHDWVKLVSSPTVTPVYGAQFWVSEPDKPEAFPKGSFAATGHAGQRVTIIPAHDLVIVRMGLTLASHGGIDHVPFVQKVIEAVTR
jgi:CubicO group peptidase (beta-lactamase class C family)